VIDATVGQLAYRIGTSHPGGRIYYREIKVTRVTPKQIVAKSMTNTEHRFWRENGREVGSNYWYHFSGEKPEGERFLVAGCDKGRSWPT
jgi:hypothetical protein